MERRLQVKKRLKIKAKSSRFRSEGKHFPNFPFQRMEGRGEKKAEKNSNHVWERKREEEIGGGGGGGNFSLAPHLGRSSCSPNFATAQKRENESSKCFPMKKSSARHNIHGSKGKKGL